MICSRVEVRHVVIYQCVSSGAIAKLSRIPSIEPTTSVTMMEVSER